MAVLQHRLSRFARTLTIGVPCALSTAPALAQLGEAQAALSSLGGLMLVAVMLVLLAAVWLYKRQMHRMAERTRALALSEERFRVIVEGTNVVAWEYDIGADCFTYVSAPGEGLLGFQIEDWKQSGFWRSRLHPDDRDAAMAFLRRQLVADAPHDCEYRMRHADGHVIFVRDLRSPIAAGGHVMGMRGIFVDITAYKASEAALEDSEARFRSAYEQAAVGMALCAISGRFVRVNPRYCDITGYTEKELLERDFREITWREDVEGNDRLLDGLVIGNSAKTSMEKRIRRPDGSVVWVNLSIALVKPAQGGASHFMEVIEDITARRHAESELRESEGRMRSILSAMNEGVILRNAGGDVIVANGAARRIYGVAPGAALPPLHDAGTRYLREDGTTCPVEELPSFHAMHTGESRAGTVGIERGDGSRVWFVSRAEPLQRDSRTGLYPVVLTLNDVTGQRRAEEELRLAATVFDNSIEAIMITDAHRHILSVNRAFTDLTGYEPAQVLGNTPALLAATSANDSAQYDDIWLRAAQAGAWQGETWQRRRDGSEFLEWLSVSAVYDPRGQITHFVAVFSDITERKASEARIAYLAHHDPLTELPNRTLFQDRLEQALARAERHHQRVALLFLDLDRFKTINDSLGHLAGDRLLQAVSSRLKDCVRTTDTICRQGGDEFIIVLADVGDPETPARVADKILRCLSEPFDIDGHRLGTSFSIGIAIYPDDGRSVDSLMKNADTAMYHAKENGRNTYRFFTEAMNANALERLHLESQLRQALERGELLLNYQPQVDLGTGAILGAEALIRWQSEALGFVPPGRFIPIAEESGLIVPIGRWVLRQACLHARTWQDAGLAPVGVAVNISALQFARDDIVTAVSEVLAETGLAPERLELELTESLLMHQGDEVLDTMHRLKALGVRLSIDDFGTGYSSLSYLKRFAVDRLKIDQGFVRDIADDPDDAAIVRAIIQLGRSLKLDVIAEGAEARAQVDFLLREGCRKAQGYFFCPPVTHDVFMSVLRRGLGARQNEHRALITH